MKKLNNYLKTYLLFFIILLIYLLIISIFYYFKVFNYKTVSIINYIFTIILFFLLGFKVSNLEKKKGYLNGFLVSLILVFIFIIINLFKIDFTNIIYYVTLISSSIVGGIFGVK